MKRRYDIQDGVHVDIELGAVHACLYEVGVITHRATRHVRVREDVVLDFLRDVNGMVREACDTVAQGVQIKKILLTVHTPLTFFIEDSFSYENKKDIPNSQVIVQEIEVTLPPYITNVLGLHTQDGILVQHVPDQYTVRGFEVPTDTHVQGSYQGVQTLQWVTRSVYEAVRELANTHRGAEVVYQRYVSQDTAVIVMGTYMSRFTLPRTINELPIGIGEKSLVHMIADTYNVPEVVIKSTLRAHVMNHVKKSAYITYATNQIYDAFEKVLHFANLHSYQNTLYIEGPYYLEPIVRTALKPFAHKLFIMKIDQE